MAELSRQRRLVIALHGLTLFLLGLHLFVRFLPPTPSPIPEPGDAEAVWWGLWPATYPPSWVVIVAVVLVVGMLVAFWLWERQSNVGRVGKPARLDESTSERRVRKPALRDRQMVALIAISVALVIAFFAFPIVHTRWGDAYMLAKSIAWPDPALRLTHSWQAPLDVFLHSQLWLAFGETLGWQEDATPVYRWVSPLAGTLYLVVALLLARDERLTPPWLTYGLLASLGLIQLFFGYVENYSLAAVGVLAYLWLGLGVLRDERPLWMAASVLAITHATHPSTIVLAPSLLYLGWHCFLRDQGDAPAPRAFSVLVQMALPMLVVAVTTVLLMERGGHDIETLFTSDRPGGGDARLFVPLWETSTRWEHYTLFSWPHLRDFLNEQMLVAPVVLPGLMILGIYFALSPFWEKSSRKGAMDDVGAGLAPARNHPDAHGRRQAPPLRHSGAVVRFLLLSTVLYLAFIWFWNPDYGGQRDWDLFSLAALPSTLLFIALLPNALSHRWYLLMGTAPLILVQSLHTASWIYQNTLPWNWP